MAEADHARGESREDRYQGFSLQSVSWGYRHVIEHAIDELFEQGFLGPGRDEVTRVFFDLLKCSAGVHFDEVRKEFVLALGPRLRWMMTLPGVFADVVELGRELAASRIYYAKTYFRTLGEGGFGDSPEQVRGLLTRLRRLRQIDDRLALAFLKNYRRLSDRLTPTEMNVYEEEGRRVFAANRTSGIRFMEGSLKNSDVTIRELTRECRLADVRVLLERLLKALTGFEVKVRELGELDSDFLIVRQPGLVCSQQVVFVPGRVREFDQAAANRRWYLLLGVVSAAMLAEESFARLHGRRGYETCEALAGPGPRRVALFHVVEFVRVLRRLRDRWPGAGPLLDFALRVETDARPPVTAPDRLFFDLVRGDHLDNDLARRLSRLADESANASDTAERLGALRLPAMDGGDSAPGDVPLRVFTFLPDFLFPLEVSAPPEDSLIYDLKRKARGKTRAGVGRDDSDRAGERAAGAEKAKAEDEAKAERGEGVRGAFVYDEWSQPENDYYHDYCCVSERRPRGRARAVPDSEMMADAARVRRAFELLKPDETRREKYLAEGDIINHDLLLDYIVCRHKEPFPKVNFYERFAVKRRDVAVIVLLDVSGSTSKQADQERVIEVEKRAAVVLGQGLASLGDRFAICGFSGNGREGCEYFIYKGFAEPWDADAIGRVLAAAPLSSTRIGAALRHSGYRLAEIDAKQRLVILITDGKPMDNGYDPNTRYAQHDVRMACEENRRRAIHTFCISTDQNTRADMEIMFPGRRFAILSDIRQLPRVLPRAYARITT